jgi:hypothetical protein
MHERVLARFASRRAIRSTAISASSWVGSRYVRPAPGIGAARGYRSTPDLIYVESSRFQYRLDVALRLGEKGRQLLRRGIGDHRQTYVR